MKSIIVLISAASKLAAYRQISGAGESLIYGWTNVCDVDPTLNQRLSAWRSMSLAHCRLACPCRATQFWWANEVLSGAARGSVVWRSSGWVLLPHLPFRSQTSSAPHYNRWLEFQRFSHLLADGTSCFNFIRNKMRITCNKIYIRRTFIKQSFDECLWKCNLGSRYVN